MVKVKGIYQGNFVELLEPVKAKEGIVVEVIFNEVNKSDQSYIAAMKQELERMERGTHLGGGPYYQLRGELHER